MNEAKICVDQSLTDCENSTIYMQRREEGLHVNIYSPQ
jgi:hypothetical protein